MKHLLAQLMEGQPLSQDQAVEAFERIMSGQASPAQIAALLTLLAQRGPTVEELVGAAMVMRQKAARVEAPAGLRLIDTCGTGGDHAGTFNISTAAAIIAAGAGWSQGVAVAKHGNRSVTSSSGSSQALEVLGVKLQVSPATQRRCLEEAGVCFCFAPAHHPAMKHAAAVRAELGFRTIFNLVGPLTNPAGAKRQVVGVFASRLTPLIASALERLGAEEAMVVHGQIPSDGRHVDGLDELSTAGPSQVSHVQEGQIRTYEVDPTTLGLPFSHPSSLRVADPAASGAMIRQILAGQHGPARDIACLNAAAALVVAGLASDLAEGVERAAEAIDRGAAQQALDKLIAITQADGNGKR